jgi:hypothetical protein
LTNRVPITKGEGPSPGGGGVMVPRGVEAPLLLMVGVAVDIIQSTIPFRLRLSLQLQSLVRSNVTHLVWWYGTVVREGRVGSLQEAKISTQDLSLRLSCL